MPHIEHTQFTILKLSGLLSVSQKQAFEKTGAQYQVHVSGTYTLLSSWGLCSPHPLRDCTEVKTYTQSSCSQRQIPL